MTGWMNRGKIDKRRMEKEEDSGRKLMNQWMDGWIDS